MRHFIERQDRKYVNPAQPRFDSPLIQVPLLALTQNRMTVVNACVLDDQFTALEARDAMISESSRSQAVRELAAIAGICNGATFDQAELNEPLEVRKINGDATDTAILRFAEMLRPVVDSKNDWVELYGTSFNSKSKHSQFHPVEVSGR
jgi:sodium/potassium-transporting ATPase subunit alpha